MKKFRNAREAIYNFVVFAGPGYNYFLPGIIAMLMLGGGFWWALIDASHIFRMEPKWSLTLHPGAMLIFYGGLLIAVASFIGRWYRNREWRRRGIRCPADVWDRMQEAAEEFDKIGRR